MLEIFFVEKARDMNRTSKECGNILDPSQPVFPVLLGSSRDKDPSNLFDLLHCFEKVGFPLRKNLILNNLF